MHRQTLVGGKAHRGVDDLAVLDGGNGRAVAQVAGDDLHLGQGLFAQLGNATCHVAVGGTVEAVAAKLELLVIFVRQRVHVSNGLHGAVECGIEDADHRLCGAALAASLDALDGRGAVQGVDAHDGIQIIQRLVADQRGLLELTAVCDAVTDGIDLVNGCDNAQFSVGQQLEDEGDRVVVVLELNLSLVIILAGTFVGNEAANADLLAVTLGDDAVIVHIEQLIFQGRATGVNNQNFHFLPPWCAALVQCKVINRGDFCRFGKTYPYLSHIISQGRNFCKSILQKSRKNVEEF